MNKLKVKYKIIISIIVTVMLVVLISIIYKDYRIRHAKVLIALRTNLNIEVYDQVKLKDLIISINGKLLKNPSINTSKLGKQTIEFEYINEENIKVPYSFDINVVDTTPPIINQHKNIQVEEGDKYFYKELFCGDNYDDNPKCLIEGEYDINKIGEYQVTFKGIDSSNNKSEVPITLSVKKKTKKTSYNNLKYKLIGNNFEDIKKEYKTKKTKIGIDVSHWQEDINYKKVKNSGVEFAFIRLGIQKGINGEYKLDKKFKDNIEGFNKVNIPVGVYFFSYANSKKEAKKQANWVSKQLKKYDVDLEVAFDWENWNNYQDFNISFKHLNDVANTFMSTIEDNGYNSMLYSSKDKLETIWSNNKYKVWLAHYTKKTSYEGEYKYWQICENGVIDGIDNYVDINIMYK